MLASLLTLLAALSLFCRPAGARHLPARRRPQHRLHRARHVRRLHHQRLQRQLHRPRAGDRPADADLSALLPRHVPGADVRHEPRAHRQQYRPDVGGDRARDADHRADGRHLPHPRGAGSGVEILHPRQRRHRARAVRHHPRLHGGASGGRRRHRRHGVDHPGRARRASSIPRCSTSPSSSCCSATAPRSASRRCTPGCPTPMPRARRRSRRCCPGLLLNVALYAVLRFKMLLAANPEALAPGPADGDAWGCISLVFAAFMLYRRRDIKRMFAYSSIEHMGIITSPSAWAGRSRTSPGCCT